MSLISKAWNALKRACTPHWNSNIDASPIVGGAALGSALGSPIVGTAIGTAIVTSRRDQTEHSKPENDFPLTQ